MKSMFEHLLTFGDWSRPSPPLLKINAAILAFSLSAIGIGCEKNTDGADKIGSSAGLAVIGLMMLISVEFGPPGGICCFCRISPIFHF